MWLAVAAVSVPVCAAARQAPREGPPAEVAAGAPPFVGEFEGRLMLPPDAGTADAAASPVAAALEVTALGEDRYKAVLYLGSLPRKRAPAAAAPRQVELAATYRDFTLVLTGERGLRLQYIHGRYTALDAHNDYRGHLARVVP